jgi:8-oxo-dGTP diphosphatase
MPLRPLLRIAYRLAWAVLSSWWRIVPGTARAAAVALWDGDRLLVVQPSYRDELDLPGGLVRNREAGLAAALRELNEEAGIVVTPTSLTYAVDLAATFHRRTMAIAVFEWRPAPPAPPAKADGAEILWAAYLGRADVSGRPLGPALAGYLDWLEAGGEPP